MTVHVSVWMNICISVHDCCVMLCYVLLYCAVLCHAVPCHAVPCQLRDDAGVGCSCIIICDGCKIGGAQDHMCTCMPCLLLLSMLTLLPCQKNQEQHRPCCVCVCSSVIFSPCALHLPLLFPQIVVPCKFMYLLNLCHLLEPKWFSNVTSKHPPPTVEG